MNIRLKHRTLSALIVDRLRQAILGGDHSAGAQLRQDALAELYGVSRIPVREALFQLEAEGLVRIVPHKGAIVSELSLDEINDVFDLRGILEPRLLAHSAPLLEADDFERLERIQARFSHSISTRNVREWGEINAEFHLALYARAPQPRTQSIVASLLQTSDRFTRLQMNRAPALSRAEREHRKLLRLCQEGKVEQACAYLVAHIEKVRQDLHTLLKRSARAQAAAAASAATATATTTKPAPTRKRTS